MQKILAPEFGLLLALNSGQLFNWVESSGFYYLPHDGTLLKLRKQNGLLQYDVFSNRKLGGSEKKRIILELFSLDRNFVREISEFHAEECVAKALPHCAGLTITRQNPFECLLCFLLTQNSNIPRIMQNVLDLSKKYGEKICVEGGEFNLFPTAESLAKARLSDLKKLGLGYRAEYVRGLAGKICENGLRLETLEKMGYDEAKREVMEIEGVGPKVADCALLFGCGFEETFPVDVWLKKIMLKHYGREVKRHLRKNGSRAESASEIQISDFAREKFGAKAGIVHEFLFAAREKLV